MSEFLQLALRDEGHRTSFARDGTAALEFVDRLAIEPDLILSDFNLPGGLNGLQVIAKIREKFRRELPAIILTGDISTTTLQDITLQNCVALNKPLMLDELTKAIADRLPPRRAEPRPETAKPVARTGSPAPATIFIIDDDHHIRDAVRATFEGSGQAVEDYETSEAFLEAYQPRGEACLLIDAYLPGMSGLQLLQRLKETGRSLPSIMITGHGDIPTAVEAMRAGALDFIEKPVGRDHLIKCVNGALEIARDSGAHLARTEATAKRLATLTPRQDEILKMVLAGHPSKNIAADLGISQRTVENHRAVIMRRIGAKSLPELARLVLAAVSNGNGEVGSRAAWI